MDENFPTTTKFFDYFSTAQNLATTPLLCNKTFHKLGSVQR